MTIHPAVATGGRFTLFMGAWTALTSLLVLLIVHPAPADLGLAVLFSVPVAVLQAFLALAAWYPSRAIPLAPGAANRLLMAHGSGALLAGGIWAGLAVGVGELFHLSGVASFTLAPWLFFAVGALLYVLAVAIHYLISAFEQARESEARALELQVTARARLSSARSAPSLTRTFCSTASTPLVHSAARIPPVREE